MCAGAVAIFPISRSRDSWLAVAENVRSKFRAADIPDRRNSGVSLLNNQRNLIEDKELLVLG